VAGTLYTIQAKVITHGCATPYELTIISVEDESGLLDVFAKGACGRNRSAVRAPILAAGDRVDLLIEVIGGVKTNELGTPPEVIVLWIDRAEE